MGRSLPRAYGCGPLPYIKFYCSSSARAACWKRRQALAWSETKSATSANKSSAVPTSMLVSGSAAITGALTTSVVTRYRCCHLGATAYWHCCRDLIIITPARGRIKVVNVSRPIICNADIRVSGGVSGDHRDGDTRHQEPCPQPHQYPYQEEQHPRLNRPPYPPHTAVCAEGRKKCVRQREWRSRLGSGSGPCQPPHLRRWRKR